MVDYSPAALPAGCMSPTINSACSTPYPNLNKVYVIEGETRSSRTVPYISGHRCAHEWIWPCAAAWASSQSDMGCGAACTNAMWPSGAVFSEKLRHVDTQFGPSQVILRQVPGHCPNYHDALLKGCLISASCCSYPGPRPGCLLRSSPREGQRQAGIVDIA